MCLFSWSWVRGIWRFCSQSLPCCFSFSHLSVLYLYLLKTNLAYFSLTFYCSQSSLFSTVGCKFGLIVGHCSFCLYPASSFLRAVFCLMCQQLLILFIFCTKLLFSEQYIVSYISNFSFCSCAMSSFLKALLFHLSAVAHFVHILYQVSLLRAVFCLIYQQLLILFMCCIKFFQSTVVSFISNCSFYSYVVSSFLCSEQYFCLIYQEYFLFLF